MLKSIDLYEIRENYKKKRWFGSRSSQIKLFDEAFNEGYNNVNPETFIQKVAELIRKGEMPKEDSNSEQFIVESLNSIAYSLGNNQDQAIITQAFQSLTQIKSPEHKYHLETFLKALVKHPKPDELTRAIIVLDPTQSIDNANFNVIQLEANRHRALPDDTRTLSDEAKALLHSQHPQQALQALQTFYKLLKEFPQNLHSARINVSDLGQKLQNSNNPKQTLACELLKHIKEPNNNSEITQHILNTYGFEHSSNQYQQVFPRVKEQDNERYVLDLEPISFFHKHYPEVILNPDNLEKYINQIKDLEENRKKSSSQEAKSTNMQRLSKNQGDDLGKNNIAYWVIKNLPEDQQQKYFDNIMKRGGEGVISISNKFSELLDQQGLFTQESLDTIANTEVKLAESKEVKQTEKACNLIKNNPFNKLFQVLDNNTNLISEQQLPQCLKQLKDTDRSQDNETIQQQVQNALQQYFVESPNLSEDQFAFIKPCFDEAFIALYQYQVMNRLSSEESGDAEDFLLNHFNRQNNQAYSVWQQLDNNALLMTKDEDTRRQLIQLISEHANNIQVIEQAVNKLNDSLLLDTNTVDVIQKSMKAGTMTYSFISNKFIHPPLEQVKQYDLNNTNFRQILALDPTFPPGLDRASDSLANLKNINDFWNQLNSQGALDRIDLTQYQLTRNHLSLLHKLAQTHNLNENTLEALQKIPSNGCNAFHEILSDIHNQQKIADLITQDNILDIFYEDNDLNKPRDIDKIPYKLGNRYNPEIPTNRTLSEINPEKENRQLQAFQEKVQKAKKEAIVFKEKYGSISDWGSYDQVRQAVGDDRARQINLNDTDLERCQEHLEQGDIEKEIQQRRQAATKISNTLGQCWQDRADVEAKNTAEKEPTGPGQTAGGRV